MIKCYCGGDLTLDLKETKKNGIIPIYNCSNCDSLIALQIVGEKDKGWRTKNAIKNRIPF